MMWQISLRRMFLVVTLVALSLGFVLNYQRRVAAEAALRLLRAEVGYLEPSSTGEVAAVRIASDEPLVWQARVRVPLKQRYRVAYSAVWLHATNKPEWFSAQALLEGESIVTVRVMKDPRDDRWRMSVIVRHEGVTGRSGTVLADEIRDVFRGSHSLVSTGIGKQTVVVPAGQSLRIFDERHFSGGSLLLYGDRAPETDIFGVFAELQPDVGPL